MCGRYVLKKVEGEHPLQGATDNTAASSRILRLFLRGEEREG